jgi:hydroxyacylglutathione hydrolase
MLLEVIPSGPLETNAYLVGCPKTKKAFVVDSPWESTEIIMQRAKELSLDIQMILLTHSHWDHIAEVVKLKNTCLAPVYVHKEDLANLQHPGADGLPLMIPIKGMSPDGYLQEGQRLSVGELVIEVIHTPGHSPGCVCFYLAEEQVLFSGDTLFKGTIGKLSFPTSRPDLISDSLKKLAVLPPDTTVYPGHGDPTTIGAEQWIAHLQTRF